MNQKEKYKRAEIIAKGDVQRVGYRDVVEKIARKLNVNGFVENLKPYNVKIVAEGKEENLTEFINKIKIKRHPINVEEVVPEFKAATGEFEYFEIKRGDLQEELGERFDVAGAVLYESMDLQRKSLNELTEFRKESGEKQDRMMSKQDETIGSINQGFSKTHNDFNRMDVKYDKVSEKMDAIDNTLKELTKAILKLAEPTSQIKKQGG